MYYIFYMKISVRVYVLYVKISVLVHVLYMRISVLVHVLYILCKVSILVHVLYMLNKHPWECVCIHSTCTQYHSTFINVTGNAIRPGELGGFRILCAQFAVQSTKVRKAPRDATNMKGCFDVYHLRGNQGKKGRRGVSRDRMCSLYMECVLLHMCT